MSREAFFTRHAFRSASGHERDRRSALGACRFPAIISRGGRACACLGSRDPPAVNYGSHGPYLFPGPDGAARSPSAMRNAVSKPLFKHAGIRLNPHLYRHIIAKIVAERTPGLLPDLSRMLGHKSINTTYQAYLGTEAPAASRRINQLLQDTRSNPEGHGR